MFFSLTHVIHYTNTLYRHASSPSCFSRLQRLDFVSFLYEGNYPYVSLLDASRFIALRTIFFLFSFAPCRQGRALHRVGMLRHPLGQTISDEYFNERNNRKERKTLLRVPANFLWQSLRKGRQRPSFFPYFFFFKFHRFSPTI